MPRRLIEEAFPLKKVSEDSKHEKNVRHGHISTLHIWPARRPLAACRAVTIATLLPDPADAPQTMKDEYKRLSGSPIADKQRDYLCKLIEGLTRWGTEDGGTEEWDAKDSKGRWLNKLRIARELIQKAYGGQPPHVLDMFAGGGAIPLEAMRLGCKVTANDYNPVAWFLLKCTLEYPQRLAGKTHPLPQLELDEQQELKTGGLSEHVRLWGQWVLEKARGELAHYYPVVDDKPTVAYLWARTIPCQDPQCGGTVPLLKTLWVCKKPEKTLPDTPENRERPDFLAVRKRGNQTRVVINGKRALKLLPDKATKQVCFEIVAPKNDGEVDKPTMSGTSATCPFCGVQQPKTHIKRCGQEGKLNSQMTTVIYQETYGKEYRSPTSVDMNAANIPAEALERIAHEIPHGILDEPLPSKERHRAVGSQLPDYGFQTYSDLFTDRQLLALMTFIKLTRAAQQEMAKVGYSPEWLEAIDQYLAVSVDRLVSYSSRLSFWVVNGECQGQTFAHYAFLMTWDFSEINPFSESTGDFLGGLDWIQRFLNHAMKIRNSSKPHILQQSSQQLAERPVDAIITDPPYYDAIPYADLSDFFYVLLRRSIGDRFPDVFAEPLTPKSEELVQQHKTGERGKIGKEFYEQGMEETFLEAHDSLHDDARMVIVFAHKDPEAWETLVNAMVASGLVVTASWPIDTERQGKVGALGTASLATSLWFVCRKRPANAGAGHYGKVRRDMHERLTERLRYFWDAGIRGPDFVWAAIGPALESYSSYTEVRRMDGTPFTVSEFLKEVRRMVTDFALGQILHGANTEELDEWTRYYLMHRDYFGMVDAPVGECILLAQGYGLSLDDLSGRDIGILRRTASGNKRRLLAHTERDSERVGSPHPSGELPMIDKIHRVMNLWAQGNRAVLDAYLHEQGLGENELFKAVVQALIETSRDAKERSLLETLVGYEPGDYLSVSSSAIVEERQQYFEGVR